MSMIRWLQDQLLAALQSRCDHPGQMVAADVLEGCGERLSIQHCRRCGAVRPIWDSLSVHVAPAVWAWRRPDPNLWRGR